MADHSPAMGSPRISRRWPVDYGRRQETFVLETTLKGNWKGNNILHHSTQGRPPGGTGLVVYRNIDGFF